MLSHPLDVPLAETLAFLRGVLPVAPVRLLEVGCGEGALARALGRAGHDVTAIDRSPAAVEAARAAGTGARKVDFLELEEAPFDVVLFASSLHHIAPLDRAVAHARSLLRPGGLLVAEEFAVEAVGAATAEWFYDLEDVLNCLNPLGAAGGLVEDPGAPAVDSLSRWQKEHEHDPPLHPGAAMQKEIDARLAITSRTTAPYLYRTLCARLPDTDRGARCGAAILAVERRRIDARTLDAAGLRIVAAAR